MNLVMEQLQSMWRMMARWLCFFSSRPTSVILTRYIIAPDLTTAPTLSVSAVARSWPVRGAKKNQKCRWHVPVLLMKASWHPLTDPELLVFLPVGQNPAISCGEAPFGWDRQSITLHCGSPLLLSPVLLAHTTEMQVGDLSRLNPQKSDRPPAL